MSIKLERSGSDTDRLALTAQGRREAIYGLLDLSEHHNDSKTHQVRNLNAACGALMRREGSHTQADLRPHFKSAGTEDVDQRLFASFRKWWSEIGREQLLELPGVTEDDDGLRFNGIDPSADDSDLGLVLDLSDDELTVPLSALRNDPTTKARNALDERVDPHSDEHEKVLDLFETIRMAGREGIEPEALARRTNGVRSPGAAGNTATLDGFTSTLSSLPGVRKERINVTPEDVELDDLATLADLDAARARIESTPTVVWRCVRGP